MLRRAEHERWLPVRLERELAETPNALAVLSRHPSQPKDPRTGPSPYERGRKLLGKAKPLGQFRVDVSGKPRLVLLIGEIGRDGKGVVRHVVRGQEAILRRLVVSIERAQQQA